MCGEDLWWEGFAEKVSLEFGVAKSIGMVNDESGGDGTDEHGWVGWKEKNMNMNEND